VFGALAASFVVPSLRKQVEAGTASRKPLVVLCGLAVLALIAVATR
jgi:hypothetical protein